jgi:hypothetical protein
MRAGIGQHKANPVMAFTDIAGRGGGLEHCQQDNSQNGTQDDQGHRWELFQTVSQGRNPLLIAILI